MPDSPSELSQLAAVTQRLAVLLAAGVAPQSAWEHLAQSATGATGATGAILAGVAQRIPPAGVSDTIVSEVDALEYARPRARLSMQLLRRSRSTGSEELVNQAWRGVAAAWWVASEVGAPLARTLRGVSGLLRQRAAVQREVGIALAGPRSTARLVLALPVVGVLFGLALGFDSLSVLFTTLPGGMCLVAGGALMALAVVWNRRLVSSATPRDPTPGLQLDLLAIAVSGGVSLDRARGAVSEALRLCGVRSSDRNGDAAGEVLELSRRAGVPAAELLRGEAEQAREQARSSAQEAAAKLAVALMMPLGLCILPAFLLLGVAPLMIAVLSSTVTGL